MKKLVIYYSYEGNTKFIAEAMASAIDADLLELKPQKDLTTKGFMKYVWGGRQVVTKQIPELLPFDKNPDVYDVIFIGTPVWAFTFAPAIRSFLALTGLKNKKIALFCCHSGAIGKTFVDMKASLEGNQIIGEIDFVDPLRKGAAEKSNRAKEWAKKILKG